MEFSAKLAEPQNDLLLYDENHYCLIKLRILTNKDVRPTTRGVSQITGGP